MIERAILQEALGGATRTELWLASRTAWMFASEAQFQLVMAHLVADRDLSEEQKRWTTTGSGRERLKRLQGKI